MENSSQDITFIRSVQFADLPAKMIERDDNTIEVIASPKKESDYENLNRLFYALSSFANAHPLIEIILLEDDIHQQFTFSFKKKCDLDWTLALDLKSPSREIFLPI